MQFSASIEYAIHGLVFLAAGSSGDAVLAADVARAVRVPESYLRKVFQQLARAGLVASRRGAKGGFTLARDASAVTLRDVVEAIDGALPTYTCLKDRRRCSVGESCPVADAFDTARRKMGEILDEMSISELAKRISKRSPSWLKVTPERG